MNYGIFKRLEAAERVAGTAKQFADLPSPLETLSAEDQALVTACREARQRGEAPPDTPETYQAMRRLLRAAAEREQMLRDAGVPMRSVGDVIRDRRAELRRLQVAG